MSLFEKLESVEHRYQELEVQLADPDVLSKQASFQKLAKERAEIEDLVETYRRLKQVLRELEDNAPLLRESDAEMRAMAREDRKSVV